MPRFKPLSITDRKLFDPVTRYGGLVEIGEGEPNWHRFAYGYKLAADKLAASINDQRAPADYICFPVLFLYRHSVELYLKALLLDLGELFDDDEETPGQHDLIPLWQRFREGHLDYDCTQESPWLDRTGDLIAELDSIDQKSFSFRYPVAKDGESLLVQGQSVSIAHFASVMQELWVVLDGAAALLDEHLDLKEEIEEESFYEVYHF